MDKPFKLSDRKYPELHGKTKDLDATLVDIELLLKELDNQDAKENKSGIQESQSININTEEKPKLKKKLSKHWSGVQNEVVTSPQYLKKISRDDSQEISSMGAVLLEDINQVN